jgi:hypothetical protein
LLPVWLLDEKAQRHGPKSLDQPFQPDAFREMLRAKNALQDDSSRGQLGE